MKRLYLVQLYQQNKILFYLIIVFIVLQGFFTYKGVECFPFFNYGMYSEPIEKKHRNEGVIFIINDSIYDIEKQQNINSSFLLNTVNHYLKIKYNNFEDPVLQVLKSRFEKYPIIMDFLKPKLINNHTHKKYSAWIRSYLEIKLDLSIKSIQIRQDSLMILTANFGK